MVAAGCGPRGSARPRFLPRLRGRGTAEGGGGGTPWRRRLCGVFPAARREARSAARRSCRSPPSRGRCPAGQRGALSRQRSALGAAGHPASAALGSSPCKPATIACGNDPHPLPLPTRGRGILRRRRPLPLVGRGKGWGYPARQIRHAAERRGRGTRRRKNPSQRGSSPVYGGEQPRVTWGHGAHGPPPARAPDRAARPRKP